MNTPITKNQSLPTEAGTLSESDTVEKHDRQIWLDCTSLIQWKRVHLTGIQRTVVGIARGWQQLGVEARLFVFEAESKRFVAIDRSDLPGTVRQCLEPESWIEPVPETAGGAKTAMPEPGRLRKVFSRINLNRWRLQNAAGSWLRNRWRQGADSDKAGAAAAGEGMDLGLMAEVKPGDWIFSIGSECYERPHQLAAYSQFSQRGARLIRMIYDMIPVAEPQWVYPETTQVFEAAALQLIDQSHQLLTISEHSKAEITQFAAQHKLLPPPIDVIRLGDQLETIAIHASGQEDPDHRPARPFLLCLGTLEPRKNLRLLQDTWRRLIAEEDIECPDLVWIGHHDYRSAQIIHEIQTEPGIRDHIQLLDQIQDRQLTWYFDHCLATLFPSLAEGWGLPVAESLARGRLCLAANSSSIPEISDLTVLFDPLDPVSLAGLVKRTISDPSWRQQQEERIRRNYTITTWTQTARQALDAVAAQIKIKATCE